MTIFESYIYKYIKMNELTTIGQPLNKLIEGSGFDLKTNQRKSTETRTNFCFILRTVNNKECYNVSIGNKFTLISRNEQSDEFRDLFKEVFGKSNVADLDDLADDDTRNVISFLIDEKDEIHVLRQTDSNYIMNQDGKTFLTVNK